MENDLKDEEILAASLEKPAFFKILVDRYQEAFLRKALSILRRQEDAEDIVQETFVKIYFNGKKFKKMEGIEFKSWAYKILINTSFNIRGEPIVCSPEDAFNTFIKTDMDYLVLENFILNKKKIAVKYPFVKPNISHDAD